jgi:hypothetical protein
MGLGLAILGGLAGVLSYRRGKNSRPAHLA